MDAPLNSQPPHDVTEILKDWSEDINDAPARLMPLVCKELRRLPVIARRHPAAYLASKLFARHRLAIATTSLVALTIGASLLAAREHAKNVRHQHDVTQRINNFWQDMLGSSSPEASAVDAKFADVLGEASRRAKAEIANQPEVMANVLVTLGRTYLSLGLYELAVADLRAAVETSLKANGELHPATATAMSWLGLVLVYQDKATEGEQVSRKAVSLQRTLHPRGNADLGIALYGLGMNLIARTEAKAAEPPLEEAVELTRKHLGESHGHYLACLTALGLAREGAGNVEGAEMLYRRALEVGRRVEPRYRILLAQALNNLGMLLTKKRAFSQAEDNLRQAERLYRKILGDSNSNTPIFQTNLAWLYFSKADYVRAEVEYRKALEFMPAFFSREHLHSAGAQAGLGLTLTRLDRAAEGEAYLREALAIRRKTLRPDSFFIPYTESALGECLIAQKCYKEAEPLLFNAYLGLIWKLGEKDVRTVEARQRLAKLYDDWDMPDEALLFR